MKWFKRLLRLHEHEFKLVKGIVDKNTLGYYQMFCHAPMVGNCSTYHRMNDDCGMDIWAWKCRCGKLKAATEQDVMELEASE